MNKEIEKFLELRTDVLAHKINIHYESAEKIQTMVRYAPELLDALKVCEERMTFEMSEAEQLEHDLDGHEPAFCTLCMARAAIAKAEGRE